MCCFQATREKSHWVPHVHPVFLYLENANGHGIQEVVDHYMKVLADDCNVICVHQRPRPTVTNMLGLGVWTVFQTAVKKAHTDLTKEVGVHLWRGVLLAAVTTRAPLPFLLSVLLDAKSRLNDGRKMQSFAIFSVARTDTLQIAARTNGLVFEMPSFRAGWHTG